VTSAYGSRIHGGANAFAFVKLTSLVLRQSNWSGLDAGARAALLRRWLEASQMPGYLLERDEDHAGHGLAIRAIGSDLAGAFWLYHVYESVAGPIREAAKAPIEVRISPDGTANWVDLTPKP
jgi:hypothetical protein